MTVEALKDERISTPADLKGLEMRIHSCVFPVALDRCDLLLDFPGLHLLAVTRDQRTGLVLEMKSYDLVTDCPGCGVVATDHGRIVVEVIDAP